MPLTWRTTPRGVIDRTHWSRDALLRWCRLQGRAMGSLCVDHLLARRLDYGAWWCAGEARCRQGRRGPWDTAVCCATCASVLIVAGGARAETAGRAVRARSGCERTRGVDHLCDAPRPRRDRDGSETPERATGLGWPCVVEVDVRSRRAGSASRADPGQCRGCRRKYASHTIRRLHKIFIILRFISVLISYNANEKTKTKYNSNTRLVLSSRLARVVRVRPCLARLHYQVVGMSPLDGLPAL